MFSYKSKKIQLRPLQISDIERSIVWRNDPEIRDMSLSYRFPVTHVMEDNWYRKALTGEQHTKVFFAIENINDNKHIGFTHLYNIDFIASNAYFGIVIGDKTEHGKGKSKEAMHLILQFAFKQINLHKVNLEVASFNKKAVSLYISFGFLTEGILKKQVYMDGLYYDKISMAIFRDDYYSLYPQFRAVEITDESYVSPDKTEIN